MLSPSIDGSPTFHTHSINATPYSAGRLKVIRSPGALLLVSRCASAQPGDYIIIYSIGSDVWTDGWNCSREKCAR
jgi:hypothetical protein